MGPLLECVPNFSEGRRPEVVEEIVRAMSEAHADVLVLGQERDPSHHRAVVTLAGPRAAMLEAAVAGARAARDTIDLGRHEGEHPRLGALDVWPFVPLEGARMEEAVAAAREAGARIADACGIPVFLYGEAALHPWRADLSVLRRGGLRALKERMVRDARWAPDFGPPEPHPTAGATAVGARFFLIAFNVLLDTPDVSIAQAVAARVRQRGGGLPAVKALGFHLRHRNLAQVSMNLTDHRRTSLRQAFDAVAREAAALGAKALAGELVGMAPRAALDEETARHVRLAGFDPNTRILEEALAAARRRRQRG